MATWRAPSSILGAIIGLKIAPASALGGLVGNGSVMAILASKWRYFERRRRGSSEPSLPLLVRVVFSVKQMQRKIVRVPCHYLLHNLNYFTKGHLVVNGLRVARPSLRRSRSPSASRQSG
jgi:hypothetical protein